MSPLAALAMPLPRLLLGYGELGQIVTNPTINDRDGHKTIQPPLMGGWISSHALAMRDS